jgi:hypothetical protein
MDQPTESITGARSGIMRRSKKNRGFPAVSGAIARTPTGLGIGLQRLRGVRATDVAVNKGKGAAGRRARPIAVSLQRRDCFRQRTNPRAQCVEVDAALVCISSGGDLP